MMEEPGGKIIALLPENTPVQLLYRRQVVNEKDWIEVRDVLNRTGWIESRFLIIRP